MPVAVALVLASVKVLWPQGLNTSLYLDLNSFARQTAWAHGFMHAYALWLELTLMAALFLVAYVLARWRRDVHGAALRFVGGVGTPVALGLNQLVGHAAGELRPYDTYRHALVLVAKSHDFAFPSDHASVAGALFVSVLPVLRRGGARAPRSAVGPSAASAARSLAYRVADLVEQTPLGVLVRRPSSELERGRELDGRSRGGTGGEGDDPAAMWPSGGWPSGG